MKSLPLISFFIVFFFCLNSFSVDVIVEASTVQNEEIMASDSVEIIKITENLKYKTVPEILNKIPGVMSLGAGSSAVPSSIFIRGARSENTLVLLDGVELNDSMSPSRGADLSTLSAENIDRIEVYKGPQSLRFGPGALGGVINIISQSGKENTESSYSIESGSYLSNKNSLSTAGSFNKFNYAVGANYFFTKGLSAASEQSGNSEPDSSKISSYSIKLGQSFSSQAFLESSIRYSSSEVDLDNHGGRGGDDPNNQSTGNLFSASLLGQNRYFTDRLKIKFGTYYSKNERHNTNDPDPINSTFSRDYFLGENQKLQSDIDYFLNDYHIFRFSLSQKQETGLSKSTYNSTSSLIDKKVQTTTGASLAYLYDNQSWFFDVGFRQDKASIIDSVFSYSTSIGKYLSSETSKIYISQSSGFKLPSIYQKFSAYGDENLSFEKSNSTELTLEKKIYKELNISLSLFENNFRDMIDFNSTLNKYYNLSIAKTSGCEIQSQFDFKNHLTMNVGYAYLIAKDEITGLSLIRRPKNRVFISIHYSFDKTELSTDLAYTGDREDLDPNTYQRLKLNEYTLNSINGSYTLKKWLKIIGRIENLFNVQYEDIAGYGSPGQTIYVGLAGNF